jgi:hypothetical protein
MVDLIFLPFLHPIWFRLVLTLDVTNGGCNFSSFSTSNLVQASFGCKNIRFTLKKITSGTMAILDVFLFLFSTSTNPESFTCFHLEVEKTSR